MSEEKLNCFLKGKNDEEQEQPGAPKLNWYYHIVLFEEDGKTMVFKKNGALCTYKGITQNFQHRLLQHNQILAGGAKSTKILMRTGCTLEQSFKRIWKPIYIIGDFSCETYAKQFEPATKSNYKKIRESKINVNIKKKLEKLKQKNDRFIQSSICDTLKTLWLNPWTPHSPDSIKIPLTIYWCNPVLQPIISDDTTLPNYISQRVLTNEEQKKMLEITSKRQKPWITLPYN